MIHKCSTALLFFAISACSSVPDDPQWKARCGTCVLEAIEAPLAASAILSGFDALGNEDEPRAHDRLLYLLRVQDPEGEKLRLILVEMCGPAVLNQNGQAVAEVTVENTMRIKATDQDGSVTVVESRARPADVIMFDATGKEVSRSVIDLPFEFLFHGLDEIAKNRGEVSIDNSLRSVCVLVAASRLAKEDDLLSGIVKDFVNLNLMSVILNLGVSVSIDAHYVNAEVVHADEIKTVWQDVHYRFPFQLMLNGDPAIRAQATVTAARPPVGLAGGVIAISGFRPTDPRHRIDLRLIAARRGEK